MTIEDILILYCWYLYNSLARAHNKETMTYKEFRHRYLTKTWENKETTL